MLFEISEKNVNNITSIDHKTVGELTFELVKSALANSINGFDAIKKAEVTMKLLINMGIITVYDVSKDELLNDEDNEESSKEMTDDGMINNSVSPDTEDIKNNMKIILLNKLDSENMREATKEEQDSVNDYINSISVDVGPTHLAQTEKSTENSTMEDLLNKYDKSDD